jgi:hypothetical protein
MLKLPTHSGFHDLFLKQYMYNNLVEFEDHDFSSIILFSLKMLKSVKIFCYRASKIVSQIGSVLIYASFI